MDIVFESLTWHENSCLRNWKQRVVKVKSSLVRG